jgi:Kef-type K+ transport system membrane component KefB/nucleotide-binding universal stress UspA family protein
MLETFSAASHDEVLQLVAQIAILLFTARLFGGISLRLGQPAVVGEILAGVILGPSLLSSLVPWIGQLVIPQTEVQGYMLEVVALIGVMLLLVVTGLETDLALIRRRAGTAVGVAIGGLVLPFATGFALGYAIPEELLADPSQRSVFALFLATALSISAIPVLAKVLMDLDLMRRDIGQTLLAAGMIDDITGWTLLGLVTALASAATLTTGTVAVTIGMVVVFIVATVTVGVWIVDRSSAFVLQRFRGRDHMLTLVVVLAFGWGAFTQFLHLEPVLGAFAIGILFGRSNRLPTDTIHKIEAMALAVFAPIFFAVAGLKVDITAILTPQLLSLTLVVIAVATVGKVVGAYLGARLLSGQDHWSALAYGSGLNARGALEIIIATIGLSLGILTQEMFSIIVVMAIATSLMAPVALRYTTRRIEVGEEERKRLQKEAALQKSFVGQISRVLVPVRPGGEPVRFTREIQSALLNQFHRMKSISVTLCVATPAEGRAAAVEYLGGLKELFDATVSTRILVSTDPVDAILHEAAAGGYDLMVLGASTAERSRTSLFGQVIDDLIKLSPCPTMLVRAVDLDSGWEPQRILVATNGTAEATRAAELALAVVGDGVEVIGVHIVTVSQGWSVRGNAEDVTSELDRAALALGRGIRTYSRRADDVTSGILAAIDEFRVDLLVLGTSVRAGTTSLHLGPRVEHLVNDAPIPVMVVNR